MATIAQKAKKTRTKTTITPAGNILLRVLVELREKKRETISLRCGITSVFIRRCAIFFAVGNFSQPTQFGPARNKPGRALS